MKARIIHTKIHYEDDWFNTLSIGYRYIYIYLFTNSHIGLTGAYQLSKRIALIETGATEKEWVDACQKFEKDNKIKVIGNWLIVINAKKYSNFSGGKNEIAYKKEFDSLPKEIQDTVSIEYPYTMDTPSNQYSVINNQKSVISKEPEKNQKKIGSFEYLESLPEQDVGEFVSKLIVSPSQVRDKALHLLNYCQAHGKKYKNYKAFLTNALYRDFRKRPPPAVVESLAPPTPEETERTEKLRQQIREKLHPNLAMGNTKPPTEEETNARRNLLLSQAQTTPT